MTNEFTYLALALVGIIFMVLGIYRVHQRRYRQGTVVYAYGLIVVLFDLLMRTAGLI
jgi:surface polysaccharide O-acyltransferase-like enzyme